MAGKDDQKKQAEKDAQAVRENPTAAHVRAANPKFGGESFAYGGAPAKKK